MNNLAIVLVTFFSTSLLFYLTSYMFYRQMQRSYIELATVCLSGLSCIKKELDSLKDKKEKTDA